MWEHVHPLAHSPHVCSGWSGAEPKLGAQSSVQIFHERLSPRMCPSRKLKLGVELGLNSGTVQCQHRCRHPVARLNVSLYACKQILSGSSTSYHSPQVIVNIGHNLSHSRISGGGIWELTCYQGFAAYAKIRDGLQLSLGHRLGHLYPPWQD